MTVPSERGKFDDTDGVDKSIQPRPYNRLVPALMRLHDIRSIDAREMVRQKGREACEWELRENGYTNGRWP